MRGRVRAPGRPRIRCKSRKLARIGRHQPARLAEGILMRRLMLCLACVALAQPALAEDKDSAAVEKAQDRAPATPIEQPQDKASGTANETPPAASAEKAPA